VSMSEKAKTNKKWVSSQTYRDNYDQIFQTDKLQNESTKDSNVTVVHNTDDK
jgi:hypothetical protein